MAKIDIVIPMYNIEGYIKRCLDSIQKQSFTDFNCFVINDGSTDSSEKIAKVFEIDKRFKVIKKENGGLSDARNYGLKYVKSPFLLFVDGDDFLEPNCLEIALEIIEKEKADMVVFSYNQYYLETGKKESINLQVKDGTYNLSERKELLFETPNAAWNKLYKSELFINNNITYPFGKRYEDLGTTPKLLFLAKKITYINIPLYNYLIDRPNNITTQIDEKLHHLFDVCSDVIDFYKGNNAFEEYKNELYCLFVRNFVMALRKVVTLNDKKFVFGFIDHTFDYLKNYFRNKNNKYDIKLVKDDSIYLNRFLCKVYYLYRKAKQK